MSDYLNPKPTATPYDTGGTGFGPWFWAAAAVIAIALVAAVYFFGSVTTGSETPAGSVAPSANTTAAPDAAGTTLDNGGANDATATPAPPSDATAPATDSN